MQPPNMTPRDRLIVGLDLPSVEAAEAMIARLGDSVTFYKIGYQLAYAGGLPLIRKLADAGKKVFADLKLHDIGNTVTSGVESVAKLGATFLTEEVANLRSIVGQQMSLVTPGVRPAGSALGDQKRVMTPGRAIAAGADHVVVARPVMQASDPKAAAEAIVEEIAGAVRS